MLEASDTKIKDMIPQLFWEIADLFSKLDCGFVTEVFYSYVGITKLI